MRVMLRGSAAVLIRTRQVALLPTSVRRTAKIELWECSSSAIRARKNAP